MGTAVCLEIGRRRVFASALDWPGWCRSGRTEEEALETLGAYAKRYAPVAARAGVRFGTKATKELSVVERIAGNATTDFGAPGIPAVAESAPVDARSATRMAALVSECWAVFDEVVAGAPAVLRKGPRGGGRDRDKIAVHVADAEASYARKLGITAVRDHDELRRAIAESLARPSDGTVAVDKGWTARYLARRIAWHVLDHAWEIEDRSE
jgi:hypothetical protein